MFFHICTLFNSATESVFLKCHKTMFLRDGWRFSPILNFYRMCVHWVCAFVIRRKYINLRFYCISSKRLDLNPFTIGWLGSNIVTARRRPTKTTIFCFWSIQIVLKTTQFSHSLSKNVKNVTVLLKCLGSFSILDILP